MTAVPLPTVAPSQVANATLLRRVVRRPVGIATIAFLSLIGLVAIFGRFIAPLDANKASLQLILAPPSADHLLGADSSGRDVFSRLLVATQTSIAAALVALITALLIGVIAGLLASYYRGWFDLVASWLTSLVMALPGIMVLLAARAVFGPTIWLAMVIFGILLAPAFFRLVYAAVGAVRGELYVDAARVAGLSDLRIIGRHILSVVRAPILIQSAVVMSIAIAIQSGLEFLGLGDLSVPTWGGMLNDAFSNMYSAPWLMVWPIAAIALTCIALTLFSNLLRDELQRVPIVRRLRKRAVLTATGSIAAVTTSMSTRGTDDDFEQFGVVPRVAPAIVHDDDAHSRREASQPILSVSKLTVSYDQPAGGSVEVVHGVSLDIRPGEVHGLVGESGSGKTQTAFAVLGLLPPGGHISGGTVIFDGAEVQSASERTLQRLRGKRIGYVPQEPMSNLDASVTIGSQLVEPLRKTLGLSRSAATARSLDLLSRVGIPDPRKTFDSYPFEISGGMAQRVLIAGAVSLEPDLIIADEPTTALDVTVQAEVLDLLRDLQREQGMAMLLVTHNFGVVADLCDRVTVMKEGYFVEQGPVRVILKSPAHPYTQSLLNAILEDGPARPPYAEPRKGVTR
ncbi:dipeptide/oligopeptide/nickel ABC transporter permease/ATP-binding protein [Subtercola frigoramans]|uniref:ABC-type dipeptide/oligopeptide/nickel transport system ATPase component/ABC-type dipeptide/oligopeptide/nickel transport system permease subunit n=1 Tax=Subtercola frigoramans TaxID=120298 RepID=A0ABS2L7Z1_9MICO|nr:dipeptide/oligopeptide/nickel ABC transporter permease/ATP-binding protein [Subtercola frigoramans]MBM7473104.1 ABC-type dipeptide/oligopeptide/nickel transport system ATPase component/ABC-type dipeptide/oligopeptide/nickel transport system permease subunit [Subtercola frigoramans]